MTDNLDELRQIEGFPKGKDEDLLALSNSPFYTAYPNPHFEEFIRLFGTPYDEITDDYHREPFVSDVSEGKNDPIYNAHTYHTKVPPRAIAPFIEHYTDVGNIVFDGFCGTGMTGVAAQMVNRRALISDLSPAATFIAHNYNYPVNPISFEQEAKRIIAQLEKECGWMFETRDKSGRFGRINYTVWSDVFNCPYCKGEFVYWDAALDKENTCFLEKFPCPYCHAEVSKKELNKTIETVTDEVLGHTIERIKQVPVLINYSVGRQRFEKKPDSYDLQLLARIEKEKIPYWVPSNRMPEGDEARRNDPIGMTHVHHFYSYRNLWLMGMLESLSRDSILKRQLLVLITSVLNRNLYKGNRFIVNKYNPNGRINGPLSGTLYIPSIIVEQNGMELISYKVKDLIAMYDHPTTKNGCKISTQSATCLVNIPENSIDYIFTDPPFGNNIMYSELNFLWESWLRTYTNDGSEAIINKTQKKDLEEYRELMTKAFSEFFRILKPGRWITVEFHNSKASVWNAIQESLARAGFLVAQVTVLDKQHGTVKQLTSPGTVENDLIINAYKPRTGISHRLVSQAGSGLEADFVREHLCQLPVAANIERSKEMLYSKYLAYYVQHGYQVKYNGEQFYQALALWGLEERDGFWFADEAQANEYEKRKVKTFGKGGIQAQAVLFVSDERSARQWIWNFLDQPKTYD